MTTDPHGAAEPDLIELEIAAFMGPHIKYKAHQLRRSRRPAEARVVG